MTVNNSLELLRNSGQTLRIYSICFSLLPCSTLSLSASNCACALCKTKTRNMEETCVYGMEGNPFFTESLKKFESLVNGMRPRPLRGLHIRTESPLHQRTGWPLFMSTISFVKEHASNETSLWFFLCALLFPVRILNTHLFASKWISQALWETNTIFG